MNKTLDILKLWTYRLMIWGWIFSHCFYNIAEGQNFSDPFSWNRLPSETEITVAIKNLEKDLNKTISVNGQTVDRQSVNFSKVIKYHNKLLAGKREPHLISSAAVIAEISGIAGNAFRYYQLAQSRNNSSFVFIHVNLFQKNYTSLKQAYDIEVAAILNSDNGALGFAPPLQGSSGGSPPSTSTDDGLWAVIIGFIVGASLMTLIRKRLKRRKEEKEKQKQKQGGGKEKANKKKQGSQKEKEEEVTYILNLNKGHFRLSPNQSDILQAVVYKITPQKQEKYPASLELLNPEKALFIHPKTATGELNAHLQLKGSPRNSKFYITIKATADGLTFQKQVSIEVPTQQYIQVSTLPKNKRTLRPDTNQTLTIQAAIVDSDGQIDRDLTQKIIFRPQSDWIDLSEVVFDNEQIAVNVACFNPMPTSIHSHPPKSVFVSVFMEEVPVGEAPLQHDLEIQLLDCRLESEMDETTFPSMGKQSEVSFNIYIEGAGDEIGWNFKGEYRHGDQATEPLTSIEIQKKSETKAVVKLIGPLIEPNEKEVVISKTLVLSAFQADELPLERHLNIMVSREGLIIAAGTNARNEYHFTADRAIEHNFEFALNVYDPHTHQMVVDKKALSNLEFQFLNEDKESLNLVSVLLPQITFERLSGNVPFGQYQLKTVEAIPGLGNIHSLRYRVKAPIEHPEHPEIFEKELTIKLKTHGIGKEFPDWVKAYEECKYVIYEYVPAGEPYEKLKDLLERRKMTLGAEGMIELRNRIWKIASNLILAQGAEGYKSMEAWANAITTTLEWTEWAGDIAFSALMTYWTGGLGATGAGITKATMIEALNMYIYEPNATVEDFWNRQTQKFVPLLMNMAKGRLLSIENIELIVRNNKPLAWAIFIAGEFCFYLYQTKSVYEAAKLTAKGLVEEVMIRKLTKRLHIEAMNRKIAYKTPQEFFDDFLKNTKVENDELVIDQKKLLEIMRDPEQVRLIKNLGSAKVKSIFQRSRNKIYQEHDFHLKQFIQDKYGIPKEDIVIDDFRTPGAPADNVNTDRDYRILRKVTKGDGNIQYIELQRSNWLDQSYEIFGMITGKPKMINAHEWAGKHQQRGTDKYDAEACSDYSDHIFNPKTGEVEVLDSNIKQVKKGNSRLISAKEVGNMYKNKVKNAMDNDTKPEAYAQLQKAIKTLEDVREGYKKQGLEVHDFDSKLKLAMAYAKEAKTHLAGKGDPRKVTNLEKNIKNMTGHDLKSIIEGVEKGFTDLKKYDKDVPIPINT